MSSVTAKINNIAFSDFESVYIRKSVEELCGISYFSTANFYGQKQRKWDVFLDQPLEAFIDRTMFIKGTLDEIISEYDKNSHTVTLVGRDNTSVLLDYPDESVNEWKKQTIASIVSSICSSFSVPVTIDSSASQASFKIIDSFKINEGESAFDAIQRVCVENSILPISYGDGKLTLTGTAIAKMSNDSIVLGRNVESAKAYYSNVDRYNTYVVKGYGHPSDFKNPSDSLQPFGSATDAVIRNSKRKFVHLSDTEIDYGKATDQAKFMRNLRAGKSRSTMYRVRNWRQTDGSIWKPNYLVNVDDSYLRIKKQMLISVVELFYNEEDGEYTEITIVDKNTYTKNDTIIKSGFDI